MMGASVDTLDRRCSIAGSITRPRDYHRHVCLKYERNGCIADCYRMAIVKWIYDRVLREEAAVVDRL